MDIITKINRTLPEWVIVIDSADEQAPLNKMSVFAWEKAIMGICGEPKDIKRERNGSLVLTITDEKKKDRLLATKEMLGMRVKCYMHRTANRSRGVIRSRELWGLKDEEITEGLKSQGVIETRRIKIKRDDQLIDTNSFILTFSTKRIPENIKVLFEKIQVRPYIPNPMRCHGCHRYGHGQATCRRPAACYKCGSTDHTQDCSGQAKCINCGGAHPASSKECPVWAVEKEICAIKAREGLSFPEARKRYVTMKGLNPSSNLYMPSRPGMTFAAITSAAPPKKTTASTGTQTITAPTPMPSAPSAVDTTGRISKPDAIRPGAGILKLNQSKSQSTPSTSGSAHGSPPPSGSKIRPTSPQNTNKNKKLKKSGSRESMNDIHMKDTTTSNLK